MFSDSFFFSFAQSFSVSVFLTCHTVMSIWHIQCFCLSPSLAHTTHTNICHSHIMLHHVLYPLDGLCDIERSGSSNARPLMGDYWCWALIPLTHKHQTCSSVAKCVCDVRVNIYIYVIRAPQHNLMIEKKHTLTKWSVDGNEGSWLRDCTMTGPRSVVQPLYIAQHGRQEIDI